MPVLHCISSLKGTFYKKLQDAAIPDFLFLVVFHQLLHHQISFFFQLFRTSVNIV